MNYYCNPAYPISFNGFDNVNTLNNKLNETPCEPAKGAEEVYKKHFIRKEK